MRIIKLQDGFYRDEETGTTYASRSHSYAAYKAHMQNMMQKVPKKTKQQIRAEKIEALLKGDE